MKTRSVVRGVCLALFSLFASGAWAAPAITANPASLTVSAGATVEFTATASDAPGLQWQRNGVDLAGATSGTLTVSNVQPVNTGLYWLKATNGSAAALSQPAMLGLTTTSKVIGAGTEVGSDIYVASGGFTFDQVLLSGAAAAVTTDAGQMTRVTFLDPDGDLVQVELTGAGTLSITLDDVSGPAVPAKYNQNVSYMKGRAGLVITGANETTHLNVISVGTQTAVNQALFRSDVTYDGVADIGFVAISSANGKFGALNTGNVRYGAPVGPTGVFAPGVEFTGPVDVEDIDASGSATPFLVLGAATDTRVLGGDLLQTNGQSVWVSGITTLQFAQGTNTHGVVLPAQTNQAVLAPYVPTGSSTAPPANDSFASAQVLSGNAGTVTASNVNATGETGEPTHVNASGAGSSLWFAFTPSLSGTAVIDTIGSSFDTALAVYTGSTVSALTQLAQDNDSGGSGGSSKVSIPVVAGTTYRIAVGSFGSQRGNVTLNYAVFTAPAITTQPASQTGTIGGSAAFAVTASGSGVTYQWFRNGFPVAGATNATLSLTNLQTADAGSYHVVVRSPGGSVVSTVVTLSSTHAAPVISTQPSAVVVTAGQAATFSVSASGAAPLAYQWRRNGYPISGATAESYTIAAASRSDADVYDVLVYSGLTFTPSQRARLSVAPTSYPGAVAFDRSAALLLEDANGGNVRSIVILAGGKFLAAGDFVSVNGERRRGIARFNADGTLDATFTPPEFNDQVQAIAVQTDGKVLAGGWFSRVGGQAHNNLVRLNADGTLDGGFELNVNSQINVLAAQADGRILLGGYFSSVGGQTHNQLARLNADGSVDETFATPTMNSSVNCLAAQADGKIVISGYFTTIGGTTRNRLARVNADGTLDPAFDPNASSPANALALQSDGKIVLGGYFSTVGGQSRNGLARLNADGTVDTAFNPTASSWPQSLALQADGKIVVGGFVSGPGNLARFNPDGTLDSAFNPGLFNTVNAVALPGDGTMLVGGYFNNVAGQSRSRLAKFNADGTLNAAVTPSIRAAGQVRALAPAPGGKFYVGGRFTHVNGQPVSSNLMRLNADATVDGAFAPSPNNDVVALAVQGDGRLVLGGYFGFVAGQARSSLARLNADGTLDAGFSSALNGGVFALALQGDGKTVIGGAFTSVGGQPRTYLARVNADGSVDGAYAPNTGAADFYNVYALALQADGRAAVGGQFVNLGGQAHNLLAQVNADGTLDSGFNPIFTANGNSVFSLAVQGDGKLLVGGRFSSVNGQSRRDIARLNEDGTLDAGFIPGNGFNSDVVALLPQEDGRVLAAGYFSSLADNPGTAVIARLNTDGSRDTGFVFDSSSAGFRPAYALLLTDAGQLWVGGSETYGYGLARLIPASAPTVTVQPANQTATAGGSATFTVTVAGTPAPAYQWNFNGVPIAGATSATLTLTNVQLANAGGYSVTVTNGIGSVTSNVALLGGSNPAPTITTQPVDVAATAGQPATLTVVATGTGPLTYQWRRNGFPIAGATGASYTIGSSSRTDTDFYDVRVADGLSTTMSQAVRLDVAPSAYPGPMVVDPTWNVVLETSNTVVNKVLPLADGRFLVAGDFIRINGHATGGVARFTAAGAVDTTFVAPALESYAKTLAVQSDGRILVGGNFTLKVGNTVLRYLIRLNADGSLDPSFNAGGSGPNSGVLALAVAADGRIYVGGWLSSYNGINLASLMRLNADGAPDTGYSLSVNSGSVESLALQTDGKLIVGGYYTSIAGTARNRIARLNADGTIDATFDPGTGFDNDVMALALAADGKIYAGGWFSTYNGTSVARYLRLNANGSLDATFVTSNYSGGNIESLFVQADGKVLLGGSFYTIRGTNCSNLARVTADGTLDSTPALSFNSNVLSVAGTADGKILAGGYFTSVGATGRQRLVRIAGDGTVDPTVDPAIIRRGNVRAIALVPGGKLAITGDFTTVNGTGRNYVAQLNADGSLDASFNPGTGANSNTTQVVRQADGKLVVAGYFGSFNGVSRPGLVRLLADGAVDPAFAPTSAPTALDAIATTTGGKVVVAGYFNNYSFGPAGTRSYLARYSADGSFDAGWNPQPNDEVYTVAAQPDGKLLIGGDFATVNGTPRNRIARLNGDGTLDASFDPGSGASSTVTALATLPGGAAWIGGAFSSYNGTSRYVLARVLATGALDTGFGYAPFNGWSTWPPVAQMVPQNDGKVVLGGSTRAFSGAPATDYLARLNANGTADTTFGVAGLPGTIRSLAQVDDGSFYLAGDTSLVRTMAASVPAITTQPANVAASAGGSAAFSVTATGLPAPTYQWNLNGAVIPGATDATLSLANVQLANAGSYSVTITNAFGSVASNAVTLSGSNPAPTLTTQPGDVAAIAGQPATLAVAATGTGTLTYQWRRNGFPIAGATGASYTIGSASRTDTDFYDVRVADGLSTTMSQAVRLDVAPSSYPGPMVIDPTWNVVLESPNAAVNKVLPLADGRFLVAGDFIRINGHATGGVARFTAAGAIDTTFVAPALESYAKTLAVQADGKILVGGAFTLKMSGTTLRYLIRLNADGSLDPSFNAGGSGPNSNVLALAVAADGRIHVGGWFSSYNGINFRSIVRLNADGTPDTSYSPSVNNGGVQSLALQADGKLVVGGYFTSIAGTARNRIARLNVDGTVDATFDPGTGFDSDVLALALAADGKIYAGGWFSTYDGASVTRYLRLNANGSLDATFVTSNYGGNQIESMLVQPDGKVLVGGSFFTVRGVSRSNLVRVTTDGTLDSTPALNFNSSVLSVAVAADGKILAGGNFSSVGSTNRQRLVRIASDGTVDPTVDPAFIQRGNVRSIALVPGGKLAIAGDFTTVNGTARNNIAQLNADGSVDTSFNPGTGANSNTTQVVRQADGKLVVAGYFGSFNGVNRPGLVRLLADGSVDPAFAPTYSLTGLDAIAATTGGKVVVAGYFTNYSVGSAGTRSYLARFNADGSVDAGWNPQPNSEVLAVAAQPDGKLLIGGYFTTVNGTARNRIARLNADGTLDASFDVGSGASSTVTALATLPGGAAWIGGAFSSYNGTSRYVLARVLATGALDTGFGYALFNGWSTWPPVVQIVPQNDGKVVVGGSTRALSGAPATESLARLNANGTADTTFGTFGLPGAIRSLAQIDDGRFYLVGDTSLVRTMAASVPAITTQPANVTTSAGGSAAFSVTATGLPAPTYQWNLNGAPITGATGATLSLSNVQLANAGSYVVTITNAFGSVASNAVTLSGSNPAPTITTQPAFVTVTSGQPATLSVTATGTGPLAYRWRKAGAFISGATAASLTIPAATMADAAYYDVVINDGLSLGTSPQGRVTVVPAATSSHYRLDPTFTPLIESEWGSVETVAQAADGGFYASGSFTTIAGQRRHGVARFNADGTLAAAFAPVVVGNVDALVVQADGKLIVAGGFQFVNGASCNRIARLNADGTLDTSFDPGSGFNADVLSLALQADGKIVVGGNFGFFNGVNRRNLARLNSDGSLDATFAPGDGPSDAVSGLALAPGGKIIITGRFTSVSGTTRNYLARLNADGSLDPAFDPGVGPLVKDFSSGSLIQALVVQADGKVITGGQFTAFGGQSCGRIVRLTTSGSVDSAFVTGSGFNSEVLSLALLADGKTLVGGYFSSYNGTTRSYAARLNADGSLDATWAPANVPDSGVNALAAQSDGRVLMGGSFKAIGSTGVSGVARLNADGALDAAPAGAIRDRGWIYSVVPVSGGKWMIAGYFNRVNGVTRNQLARLNADGTLDAAFDSGSGFDTNLSSLAVQGDGKIIAGGWFRTYNNASAVRLARINPDGSRDASFDVGTGADASAECLAVQADGRILAVGGFTAINGVARQRVARLHPSGSVDLSFDSSAGLSGNARALVVQPAGEVVTAGYFSTYAGQARNGIVRIQADGSADDTFNVGTGFIYSPMALWLQDDGRLVTGGDIVSYNGTSLPRGLTRLNADGSLDAALNIGTGADNSFVSALVAAPGGRLLVGGGFMSFNGTARNHLAVLNADGSLDPNFSSADLVLDFDYLQGARFADDGRLLVWGMTGARDTMVQIGLVLLRPESVPAPVISTPPASQSFPVGADVTLTAAATGVGPLTYQWFKNGVAIEGATGVSLNFAPVSLANGGTYTVAVTNSGGTTLSNEAVLTVTPAVAPSITVQPKSQSVSQGSALALNVGVTGSAPFTFQWSLGGTPINGATGATYTVASTQPGDAGSYTVVVTNAGGEANSSPATITVLAAGFSGTHAVDGPGYVAGGTVTITNTITYTGTLSSLGWSALLPPGWSYASGSGQEGDVKPKPGTTDLGEWAWTTVPASPVTFRYTLNVPAGTTGAQTIAALMLLRQSGTPSTVLAKPDPLVVDKITFHAADTNKDGKLGLTELLRVIELFNARNGTVRTGAYAVDPNNTEDGFNPDPARSSTAVVSLAQYHTADTNHDGKLGLTELLRVIELYNHRNGTVRTGEYHAQAGTEDGFGVGP